MRIVRLCPHTSWLARLNLLQPCLPPRIMTLSLSPTPGSNRGLRRAPPTHIWFLVFRSLIARGCSLLVASSQGSTGVRRPVCRRVAACRRNVAASLASHAQHPCQHARHLAAAIYSQWAGTPESGGAPRAHPRPRSFLRLPPWPSSHGRGTC